jgi:hypothetical protein
MNEMRVKIEPSSDMMIDFLLWPCQINILCMDIKFLFFSKNTDAALHN